MTSNTANEHIFKKFTEDFLREKLKEVKKQYQLSDTYISIQLRESEKSVKDFLKGEQGLGCASALLLVIFLKQFQPDILEEYYNVLEDAEKNAPLVHRNPKYDKPPRKY